MITGRSSRPYDLAGVKLFFYPELNMVERVVVLAVKQIWFACPECGTR